MTIRFLLLGLLLIIIAFTSNVAAIRNGRRRTNTNSKTFLIQNKNFDSKEKDDKQKTMGKDFFPSSIPSGGPSLFPSDSPRPSPSPSSVPTITDKPSTSGDTLTPTIPPPSSQPSTSEPTLAHSEQPTVTASAQPTTFPTTQPTAIPTVAPTTMDPTQSQQPSLSNIQGYVPISFSMMLQGNSSSMDEAKILSEKFSPILDTIVSFLCEGTEFAFYDGEELICPSPDVFDLEKNSLLRIDKTTVTLPVQSYSSFSFRKWTINFPITQIGEFYRMEPEDALSFVQLEAQSTITNKIRDGSMDRQLDEKFSVVGLEVVTWNMDNTHNNNIISSITALEYPYFLPIEVESLSPLRIVGLIMFGITTLLTFMVIHFANKRRIAREWDNEFQERGKGGLVTEEGVDYILAAGRPQVAPVAEQEDNIKLPLPGYMMNVELFGNEELSCEGQPQIQSPIDGSQLTASQIST